MSSLTNPWWQQAVFYQIYPRSFADGNGDGIGDLAGMIGRLDYLRDLGIDALWLSPHYPSPLYDCGYDIADYTGVAPEYGTLEDFGRFLDAAHDHGIRVILDLVLNHTSDQHPWFIESRSSRDNPRRDWYIWRDGRDGGPPNNWDSSFGGPAWEYDPATGQYYYHYFFRQQPDLNWRNPEVKRAMFEAVRFWLRLGVDGYRLDAIDTIFEDPEMPDHEAGMSMLDLHAALQSASEEERPALFKRFRALFGHQVRQPGLHELMKELRAVIDEFPDRMLVGETDDIAYYGSGDDELHMVFNFPLMRTRQLTASHVRANQKKRLGALPPGAWPCNTLGNHDSPRVWSRFGDGEHDGALARLHLALVLSLRGTPFLYNGEEIGMTDLTLSSLDQFRDMIGVWAYRAMTEQLGMPPEQALAMASQRTRDKNRTPMQWANAPNGGFCPAGVTPWLPVNPNYAQGVNVAEQLADPGSLLSYYRRLLAVRHASPALIAGSQEMLDEDVEDYVAFLRRIEGQTCLVVLNFSAEAQTLRFDLGAYKARLLFSSQARDAEWDDLGQLAVAPFEAYIAELA